jgi:NitT/TauT family transport system substrate-binding protein
MQLNWHAQADFGGYFTAKAEGIYDKAGLEVTLKQGGPQLNIHQLLAAGQVDFVMGTSVRTMVIRNQGIPIVAVGAFYQRDPVTFMVHADSGYNKIADLKGKAIYLPGIARLNYWPWMRSTLGFSDDQIKPFDPSYRAVTLDKTAASQGYLTEDGYAFKKLGMTGKSLWLADFGWNPYSSTLDTTERLIAEKPKVVEAFLKATAEGYRRYLQDPAKGFALIHQANPSMSQEQMEYTYSVMKSRNLMDPPGVKIGTMTDERWAQTFKILSESGVVPAGFDYRKAYTLQFVKAL